MWIHILCKFITLHAVAMTTIAGRSEMLRSTKVRNVVLETKFSKEKNCFKSDSFEQSFERHFSPSRLPKILVWFAIQVVQCAEEASNGTSIMAVGIIPMEFPTFLEKCFMVVEELRISNTSNRSLGFSGEEFSLGTSSTCNAADPQCGFHSLRLG